MEPCEGVKESADTQREKTADSKAQEAHVVSTKTPQKLWFPMAPLPTDICRVSPFFPLVKRDLTERPYIKDMVITVGALSRIRYSSRSLREIGTIFDVNYSLCEESKYMKQDLFPYAAYT